MARYKADIQGSSGPTSRLGTAESEIWSHTRGWDVGVEVYMYPDDRKNVAGGEDKIKIYLTAGSNRQRMRKLLGTFTRADLEGG